MASELGSTPEGSAWCLKALHPSDPTVEVRGIPDRSSCPTTLLNYQTMHRVGPTQGSTGTWNLLMQCIPHPLNFAWYARCDAEEVGLSDFAPVLNSQLSGTNINDKALAWAAKAERWRLAYAGITFHFDGPALANQGTLACAQVPYAPRTRHASVLIADGELALPPICAPDGRSSSEGWVRGSDFPSFDTIQSMPNCYVGEAKQGMYVPLKLTKTCQQWHSASDTRFWTKEASLWGSTTTGAVLPQSPTTIDYPFPGLPGAYYNVTTKAFGGVAIPPMGNDYVASIAARNLSVDSSLIVEFRYGFEVQCEPGTELTPFLHLSPPHDSVALHAYSSVSRELKDAYPAEYNDLGKLWSVIKDVARVVAPALMAVPKIGPVLSGAATLIGGMKPVGGSKPAAAEERERQEVNRRIRSIQVVTSKPNKVVARAAPKAKTVVLRRRK